MQHEQCEKQPWVEPKLILLERGDTAECVLDPCYHAEANQCIFSGQPSETLATS